MPLAQPKRVFEDLSLRFIPTNKSSGFAQGYRYSSPSAPCCTRDHGDLTGKRQISAHVRFLFLRLYEALYRFLWYRRRSPIR
jgi:hypothetical protein